LVCRRFFDRYLILIVPDRDPRECSVAKVGQQGSNFNSTPKYSLESSLIASNSTLTALIRVSPQSTLSRKVVITTGGTTGLGLSASQTDIATGAKVVAVGRNRDSAASAAQELRG
jgi:hypothetical protein